MTRMVAVPTARPARNALDVERGMADANAQFVVWLTYPACWVAPLPSAVLVGVAAYGILAPLAAWWVAVPFGVVLGVVNEALMPGLLDLGLTIYEEERARAEQRQTRRETRALRAGLDPARLARGRGRLSLELALVAAVAVGYLGLTELFIWTLGRWELRAVPWLSVAGTVVYAVRSVRYKRRAAMEKVRAAKSPSGPAPVEVSQGAAWLHDQYHRRPELGRLTLREQARRLGKGKTWLTERRRELVAAGLWPDGDHA